MADRRMFTKKITDGDNFTTMPPTAQCLYFHLCMGADDEGFSNNIRIAMFNAHATTDDFNTLVNKRFIIPFDSGVIVIKHWKMHNYIQSDRFHETKFLEEKAQILLKNNGVYTVCIQNVSKMDTEVRLGKDSLDKERLGEISLVKNNQPEIDEIISYLNIVSSKNFRSNSKATNKYINARLSEGYTVDDFKKVMDNKAHWLQDKKMAQYFRPTTLFSPEHFEAYLNETPELNETLNEKMLRDMASWGSNIGEGGDVF